MDKDDAYTVDGIEVRFQRLEDGDSRVLLASNGEELGRLRTTTTSRHYEAITPDGHVLQTPSRWSGTMNAAFGTRELAVRALLKERKSPQE